MEFVDKFLKKIIEKNWKESLEELKKSLKESLKDSLVAFINLSLEECLEISFKFLTDPPPRHLVKKELLLQT